MLQETYLGCITIQKVNFFWQQQNHIFLKKTEISKSAYFALSSLLVVAKSTLNFFSSDGHTTLAVFEQVFYPVDLRNKLPLNTNQLTCGSMLLVSSFLLASFIASDLTKKRPFMKFETKLLASSLLC